ncbi:MAG: LapA family protein [Candidatus Sumerlaeota bacterium]
MKTVKMILLLVVALALVLIVLQNQAPMQVRFLWMTGEVPGVILLFLTASAGFVLGIFAALLIKLRAKSKA